MTADEARALIPSPTPEGPRRQAVNARLAKFRNDIKAAAEQGHRTLNLCDVRKMRQLELTEEEEAAVRQQLVADGYVIDDEAGTISWPGE